MFNYTQEDFECFSKQFQTAVPFDHIVLDNFLNEDLAREISGEFLSIHDPIWYSYNNPIEKKRTMNIWDRFQPKTYQLFMELCKPSFVGSLSKLSGITDLYADYGLSGGGQHLQMTGQKLNIHLDYSIHQKLKMERRLNIIIYVTPDWDLAWGGGLELWSHDEVNFKPLECIKKIDNVFNRAVIFNTNKHSWHGSATPINCPANVFRKSLAAYYVTTPSEGCDPREKARFAPAVGQENDPEILELIRKRASSSEAASAYKSLNDK